MTVRTVALLSGGLDSMLAIRILQEQGVEVEALNFRTTFVCCQDEAGRAADELGVRLSVVSEQDDYLDLVKAPRHGYGRGAESLRRLPDLHVQDRGPLDARVAGLDGH